MEVCVRKGGGAFHSSFLAWSCLFGCVVALRGCLLATGKKKPHVSGTFGNVFVYLSFRFFMFSVCFAARRKCALGHCFVDNRLDRVVLSLCPHPTPDQSELADPDRS